MKLNASNKITLDFIQKNIENISMSHVEKAIKREEFIRRKIIDSPTLNQYLPKYDSMINYLKKSKLNFSNNDESWPLKTITFALNYIDEMGDVIPDTDKFNGNIDDEQILLHCYYHVVNQLGDDK